LSGAAVLKHRTLQASCPFVWGARVHRFEPHKRRQRRVGRVKEVFVAASSECFPDLSLDGVLRRLVDLEYTAIEIAIHERDGPIKPSTVLDDLESVIAACRETYRMTVSGYSVDIEAEGDEYYRQFAACCRLAKATKVVSLTVPAAELGTPFNAEIERLQQLVEIASREGVLVGIKTETGRITQDPDTAVVLCDNVKGLGITLDPSHYIYGPHAGGNYDQVMKHVYNVHLRDTTKDKLQVRVGQGEVEYSRLLTQLARVKYHRALVVHIAEMENVDHAAELRKMRLLLESML
jgi:sugar phosphate isomerase/epimerase